MKRREKSNQPKQFHTRITSIHKVWFLLHSLPACWLIILVNDFFGLDIQWSVEEFKIFLFMLSKMYVSLCVKYLVLSQLIQFCLTLILLILKSNKSTLNVWAIITTAIFQITCTVPTHCRCKSNDLSSKSLQQNIVVEYIWVSN